MTKQPLNVLYPEPFEGLDFKTCRDLVDEAFDLTDHDIPTEPDLWHARRHLTWPVTDNEGGPLFKFGEDPCAERKLRIV